MTELSKQQKKDYARSLYVHEQLTQQEIADRVGAAAKTVSRWIQEGKWKDLKVSITITREEQIKNIYNQLKELNDEIASRDGKRYPTPAESDTINKLAGAIQKMETDIGIVEIVNVSKGLLDFVRKTDVEKAKELSSFLDAYIKEKIA